MPKHVFDEMLKEHENGDIAYALNSAVDYEKKVQRFGEIYQA